MVLIDRDCAKEQTGHGSPMPEMVHGGPGRAGGGEELGGMRSLHHYMQRTALQGSPAMLSNVTASWIKGAPTAEKEQHPFRYHFEDLEIGQTFFSKERTITLEDVEHFASFHRRHFLCPHGRRGDQRTPLLLAIDMRIVVGVIDAKRGVLHAQAVEQEEPHVGPDRVVRCPRRAGCGR